MDKALVSRGTCLVVFTIGCVLAIDRQTQAQTREVIVIRGHAQALRLYGARGGAPVVVSSGDGGWLHLGPHVAETLAAKGFFVVGFDVKAYLESFTAGSVALTPDDEPGDYNALAVSPRAGRGRNPF
jgi:hypothetical protein